VSKLFAYRSRLEKPISTSLLLILYIFRRASSRQLSAPSSSSKFTSTVPCNLSLPISTLSLNIRPLLARLSACTPSKSLKRIRASSSCGSVAYYRADKDSSNLPQTITTPLSIRFLRTVFTCHEKMIRRDD
jgi:hypothetical protein